jgi:hypothetical protein
MNCAEAYSCTPHKQFQTCHAHGVIDAEIAEKGHLWMETRSYPGRHPILGAPHEAPTQIMV